MSAYESSTTGMSSDGGENITAVSIKKRKASSIQSESFAAMSAEDEEDDDLSEFRKWNLYEKISDTNTYNADYVKFFDAKGKNFSKFNTLIKNLFKHNAKNIILFQHYLKRPYYVYDFENKNKNKKKANQNPRVIIVFRIVLVKKCFFKWFLFE